MCGWHMCLQTTCGWRTCLQMMCGWDLCLQTTCRWCADDIQMTPGVVLHEIGQLRQVCRWCADNIQTTYVIYRWNLTRNLTLVSSARRLHVVCMRWPADDVWTMCTRADNIPDDVPDDICQISNELSLSCRLRVICTRLQFPDYFKLNSRGQLC